MLYIHNIYLQVVLKRKNIVSQKLELYTLFHDLAVYENRKSLD